MYSYMLLDIPIDLYILRDIPICRSISYRFQHIHCVPGASSIFLCTPLYIQLHGQLQIPVYVQLQIPLDIQLYVTLDMLTVHVAG